MLILAVKQSGRGIYVGYYFGSLVYVDLSQRQHTTIKYPRTQYGIDECSASEVGEPTK